MALTTKSKSVTPQAASSINGIDMHAMVKQLQDEKNGHEQGIEHLTLGELREKNRRCYVPRMRSKEELLMQVKFKKSWKGSGNQNTYFM
mmetsp:Transcript_22368/g.26201  ORF Transcript_22368/g.26201 Transcript_22368/m.26201 type:complete len:89 (+) Transcript_22368:19-285(+)